MRLGATLLLAACGGSALAPVTVRLVNAGGDAQVLVVDRAIIKLNPSCTDSCEERGGLEDAGVIWASLPQHRVDAGASPEGAPRLVAVDSFVETTVFYGVGFSPFSFAECDAGVQGVPGDGMVITVTADGGSCSFDYALP